MSQGEKPLAASKERAENRGDFFNYHAQTQTALAQFGIQSRVGAFGAFQHAPDLRLMPGKAFGVRMARVPPVAQEALAKFRHAPDEAAIFQLGVFLEIDAIDEHV